MKVLINTIQNIEGIKSTETWISLDQAFERQVWVKEYGDNKAPDKKASAKKKSGK